MLTLVLAERTGAAFALVLALALAHLTLALTLMSTPSRVFQR